MPELVLSWRLQGAGAYGFTFLLWVTASALIQSIYINTCICRFAFCTRTRSAHSLLLGIWTLSHFWGTLCGFRFFQSPLMTILSTDTFVVNVECSELTNKRVQKLLRNSSNNASLCTNGEVCAELFYPSECRWHQVKGMQTTGAATGQLTLVPNISQLLYDNIQYSRFKFKSNTDQPSNSI